MKGSRRLGARIGPEARAERKAARSERLTARKVRLTARSERLTGGVPGGSERVTTGSARLSDRLADRRERLTERREGRRRRSPEVARMELLDAAERIFAKYAPDDVGLKDIAREAGTSHALITHYFGTYGGLVEEVLQRRILRLREQMAARLQEAGAMDRPEELLAIVFRTLGDPVHLRLMKWVVASDRQESMHVFALQHQGVTLIAHQVTSTIAPPTISADARRVLVEKLELALMTALAAAMGYAFGKGALAATVGREPNEALDDAVRKTLAAMLKAYIAEAIG